MSTQTQKTIKVRTNDIVPEKFANNYDKALYFLFNDMANEDVDGIERLTQNYNHKTRDNIVIPQLLIAEILLKSYVPYRQGKSKNLKKVLES